MEFEITLEDLQRIDPRIFVVLNEDKLKEIRQIIKNRHKTIKQFSKIIECNESFLGNILRGERKPKLIFFQKIRKLLDVELIDIANRVVSKIRPNTCFIDIKSFPIKFSTTLASLVGHSFGDGHLNDRTFSFTNKYPELIDDVIEKVHKLPIQKITMNKRFHKAIMIEFPKLVRDVLVASGGPVGNKIKKSFKIPGWIKDGSTEIKGSFLQALFDDEGSVKAKSREIVIRFHKAIELAENLHQFLEDVKFMLKELGIEGATTKESHRHEGINGKTLEKILRICGTFNFVKFQENIGFVNPRKKESLKRMIKNTQKLQLRVGEAKNKIIGLLKNSSQLNTLEIAKLVEISHMATLFHLRQLEKEILIKRTRPFQPRKPHLWFLNIN